MFFIERNQKGEIIAVRREANRSDMEIKETVDDEILKFLGKEPSKETILNLLTSMDTELIRTLEDLINLLVNKNLIMFTELPEEAQQKIRGRQKIRQQLNKNSIMVDDVI